MSTPQTMFDSLPAAHDPSLYAAVHVAKSYEGLDDVQERFDEALEEFQKNGFISVQHAFSQEEVDDCLQALTDMITGKNTRFAEDVKETYKLSEAGQLDYKSGARHPFLMFEGFAKDLSPEEQLEHVRKLMGFVDHDPRVQKIAYSKKLLEILCRILGTDSTESLQLFQDMALLKGLNGREKPWHQDHAYFNVSLGTRVIGLWIALDPATEENGCMRCLPGLHINSAAEEAIARFSAKASHVYPPPETKEDPAVFAHFMRRDYQLCDDVIEDLREMITSVPLSPGGVMIFDSKLPHGTPTNLSKHKRRAVQFHFAHHSVTISDETRLKTFGTEGVNVQC